MTKLDSWLNAAVSGIRFGPDREAVREELSAHLEDKAAGLLRAFPDMELEEAQTRALGEMGDAAELAQTLAQVHRPWLGYLWTASRWLRTGLLGLFLLFCAVSVDHYASSGFPLWGATGRVFGPVNGARAELGGYVFQIVGAAYLDAVEQVPGYSQIQVTLRVSSPKFWARISPAAVSDALTVTAPDGSRFPMDRQTLVRDAETETYQVHIGLSEPRWGLFWREFSVWLPGETWVPGGQAELEFAFEQGRFVLAADVPEAAA